MSSTNHDQHQQDNSFSGTGDIDRVTGSNTSDRSRDANAQAAASLDTRPNWDRADINSPMLTYTYGAS